MNWAALV